MAEDDWYFGVNQYHVTGVIAAVGGLVFIVAGLLGYNTARVPPGSSRWVDGPIWDRVLLGLVSLGIGVFRFRQARRR